MAKFIIDTENTRISKSLLEMILENELDCKIYVKEIELIDEEKLDELARETYSEEYIEIPYHDYVDSAILRIGFKAGYRKAMEE